MVGYAGGQEVGMAVRHVDQVGRVDGSGKCSDTWSREGNGLDVIRRDLACSGRGGGSRGQRMGGVPARYQLDGHVRDYIPGVPLTARPWSRSLR